VQGLFYEFIEHFYALLSGNTGFLCLTDARDWALLRLYERPITPPMTAASGFCPELKNQSPTLED